MTTGSGTGVKQQRDTTRMMRWWAAGYGAVVGIILETIQVVANVPDASQAFGWAVSWAILAIPIGVLSGLASLGVGLLADRLARRVSAPGSTTPANAAMLAVCATGAGIAAAVVYGYAPIDDSLLWVAIPASALGGFALRHWVIRCDPSNVSSDDV